MKLILASSSAYRKSILQKLCIPFSIAQPDINEDRLAGESAEQLVYRLAQHKASVIGKTINQGFVIGSDQVANHNGTILGKPHTFEKARLQLQSVSGSKVEFVTGLSLFDCGQQTAETLVDKFEVVFRRLRPVAVAELTDGLDAFGPPRVVVELFPQVADVDSNALRSAGALSPAKVQKLVRAQDDSGSAHEGGQKPELEG